MQKNINRYLTDSMKEWLPERMVFLGGPRQVGKTFLAKQFLKSKEGYLSWDSNQDRENLKKHILPNDQPIVVIDELHKYTHWRKLLKGYWDKNDKSIKVLVTGSARLDHFRKGGDSLFGRYHYFRLHPFSVNEVESILKKDTLNFLMRFGGFPEPLLRQSESFAKIWRKERVARIIHEDLRDLTQLKDFIQIELLADALPSKVGSLLSINSLAEDLQNSPHTIVRWIEILGSVYNCFLIAPYGPPKIKAIKKQQKLYLWDWSSVPNTDSNGPRFENLVASQLHKYCHFTEDTQGDKMELRFLRDQFGREIDFVVLRGGQPEFAVECKTGDKKLSPHIQYYKERTKIPKFYQVHMQEKSYLIDGVPVMSFVDFCRKLNLP